ncbi:hypothetical protein FGG08_000244 [Glutinoglossum americanum]|uniref:Dihydroxyacetone kinase n=1 Tax=Glutinoglossum americanum TaxID=1670608 RepID=A0A9P8L633_9PEZI|nr:hypothetical protein FGG08_000244 [Glutinoglossum americanum]
MTSSQVINKLSSVNNGLAIQPIARIKHPSREGICISMAARHFINDPTHLVNAALHAVTLANPSVALDGPNKIIYRRPAKRGWDVQVSLVSGGGSGHEPSFAAFVGRGLLSAAVAGTIFASPSAEQVRTAVVDRVDGSEGVLVVVMNYTGDVLNFGMAVEKAKASGLRVEMVVVGDDVGVGRKKGGKVGRRGIAGTVLVHKIAGAMAAKGATLEEVRKVASLVSENVVSVGASLSHVHVPGRAPPGPNDSDETLSKGEIEIGMGIHNEPGSHRVRAELPQIVKAMLAQLLDLSDEDRAFLEINAEDNVVLLINNLGGVSVLELGGITAEIATQLKVDYSIEPVRVLTGTYMTSLNGLGFSITLMRVADTGLGSGNSLLELLDAPAEAAGWSATVATETWMEKSDLVRGSRAGGAENIQPSGLKFDVIQARKALISGLDRVIAAEPDVTKYDTLVGDGDCGIGLKRGAESSTLITPSIWSQALQNSVDSLANYTPAQPGDRTLIDTLHPFVITLSRYGDLKRAAKAAREGADSTKGMKASLGRTVYVGGEGWREVPDPGAVGLAAFLEGLAEGS